MGRTAEMKEVELSYVTIVEKDGVRTETRTFQKKMVQFFGWEKLDYVDKVKAAFGL
jgi:S-adenosylmethionine synthetase